MVLIPCRPTETGPRYRIPIPSGTLASSLDLEKRHIARAALQTCRPLEQPDRTTLGQALRSPPEPLVLTQQCHVPAARDPAFRLPLGTDVEIAQPPEIAVGAGLENEYIDLVRRDADGRAGPWGMDRDRDLLSGIF